ncbi:MAG: tetratricopeptide repeat protein [candidate division Zixibacteria bacterium]|jgi:tetratricopeptide (TPR) repeat protein|nr:tetratricopeptide repeat protein [candidate division Zixibacteria bacterium]
MTRWFIYCSVVVLLAVAGGCSSGKQAVTAGQERAAAVGRDSGEAVALPADTGQIRPYEPISPQAYWLYVEGIIREEVGRLDSAALFYRYAWQYFPESYEIGYSLARVLYRLGEPKLTIDVADRTFPKTAELWELAAAAYYELRNNDSVMIAYHHVVQLDPNNATAFNFLAGTYRLRGQLDSAAWAYSNLARLVPENFRPLQELGRIEQQRGRPESAREAYLRSVALDSSRANVPSMAGLGEIYGELGQPDTARYYYLKALQADPSNELVHMLLVSHYIEQDSLPAALTYSERLAQLAPDNTYAKRRLGLLYLDLDSLAQADSVFTALIESGDRTWFNYSYLGEIDLRDEQYASAVENFTNAAERNDTIPGIWLNLGLAYRKLDRTDDAVVTYRRGLESIKDPKARSALFFALAVAYEQSNQVDPATAAFEALLKVDPDNAQALNYLGYMLADRSLRLDYARDLIARAVAQEPRNAAYLDSYGWVYYRLGDYDRAVEYLSQAVTLGSDPIIFDHLGDAYHAAGDRESARQWWQRALELQPENEAIREKLSR